jgi:3',5'-cyclic AMP phosphodiesterase CpdA
MNQALQFRDDGSFTIVQFTDLHWQDGGAPDRRTRSLMEIVLDAERPDLVALTGDVIEGGRCSDPANSWRQAVEPMESRAIAWAAVFGNHDDEGALDRRELMAVAQTCRMCLSESGPAAVPGVGNFALASRSARFDAPAAVLWFLDSGSYAPDGSDGYAWVTPEQIDWLRRQLESAQRGLPALVFLHIPIPEFADVWHDSSCRGSKHEDVQCPKVNSGLFAALRESPGVLGVFAGHDHINDYDGVLDGIRLCYGRATGYGSYGRDGFARGARVIRLTEGRRDFDSWLRLDDETIVRQSAASQR